MNDWMPAGATGMTPGQVSAYLRAAVDEGYLIGWSRPAPNVWYLNANYGPTVEMSDQGAIAYATMLKDEGLDPIWRSDEQPQG